MNQILYKKIYKDITNFDTEFSSDYINFNDNIYDISYIKNVSNSNYNTKTYNNNHYKKTYDINYNKKSYSKIFSDNFKKRNLIILSLAICVIIVSISIYFFIKYKKFQKENFSKNLISNFNITTLYSNISDDYNASKLISSEVENSEPFVIGLIQIDSIKLTYPILSTTSDELLLISPCRFYGPMPNEVGNLCIAGHNNINDTQFGKLHSLHIGDIIKIFDLNGNCIEYQIYDKKEISSDDLSCTDQNTYGYKEITLITCNNIKGNRVCIRAREI